MKHWDVEYIPEALNDRESLEITVRNQVDKAIRKESQNPLPRNEGGNGAPLGNKQGKNLTGLCKIKLKRLGIRIVYKLVRDGAVMKIVVIAARADDEVYEVAEKRRST